MSELKYVDEAITSTVTAQTKENIALRRTIVYQTIIDPSVARIAGEKNKHKLFNKFLFQINNPEEIEFVSTEKYYEPFITSSGAYLIDYYRKCEYNIRVDPKVTEVILLNHTFLPKQATNSNFSENSIKLQGEERIVKTSQAFLFLDRNGKESNISEFPSAPSEESPHEIVKSFKLAEIGPDMDVEILRKKIAQRPNDVNRIVNEAFEIDERSIIYRPIFKITYKCPRLSKEAYLEIDGITSKLLTKNQNVFSATISAIITKLKRLFSLQ